MTKLICQGYTTHGLLDIGGGLETVMLSSFSASMTRQQLQSQAMLAYGKSVNSLSHTRGPLVLGPATISLNAGYTPSLGQLAGMLEMLRQNRNNQVRLRIRDTGVNIDWGFAGYVTSFGFNLEMNALVTSSLALLCEQSGLGYEVGGGSGPLPAMGTGRPVQSHVPYWDIFVSENGVALRDVTSVSFSFTQTVTPRHECSGDSGSSAPAATYMLFSLPQLTLNVNQLLQCGKSISTRDVDEVCVDRVSRGKRDPALLRVKDATAYSYNVNLGNGLQSCSTEYYIRGYLKEPK